MKSFFRLSLATIAFLFIFNMFAVTETKAQGVLGEVLKRMDANNKSLQTLKANVAMDKFNSQLDEHDLYDGKAIYLPQKGKSAYVRIDWSKPVEESLAVIGKEYQLYRPRLQQMIVGNVDKAQGSGKSNNALSFINMSKAQLKANYSISYIGQESISGAVQTWHIQLTPLKATSYKVADLWVDGDGMPRQMKITENNNDTTTVVLSGIEKNVTINASVFKINPPPGTKIVKG
ncbi:hypothetical protein BH10ACI1_BH10ACI1_05270 [soil metagenome]